MRTSPDLLASPGVPAVEWVKSSHSNGDGGNCVEWAPDVAATAGGVPVRDSKDPAGPALLFSPAAWSSFLTAVRAGESGQPR